VERPDGGLKESYMDEDDEKLLPMEEGPETERLRPSSRSVSVLSISSRECMERGDSVRGFIVAKNDVWRRGVRLGDLVRVGSTDEGGAESMHIYIYIYIYISHLGNDGCRPEVVLVLEDN
jgi:hypothetical protein